MGCCPAGAIGRKRAKDAVIDSKQVQELRARLKLEKMNQSFTPMSEETLTILRKAKAQ